MKTKSPYAHVFQWLADGKRVALDNGVAVSAQRICELIAYNHLPENFTLAADNITRTVTFPRPMRVAPEVGTYYYLLDNLRESRVCYSRVLWLGKGFDNSWLADGKCFDTKEKWTQARDAICGMLKAETP